MQFLLPKGKKADIFFFTYFIILGISISVSPLYPAFLTLPGSNGYAGTLGAGMSTGWLRLGIGNNPATHLPRAWGFGLSYTIPFMLNDISEIHAGAFWDASKMGMGIQYRQFRIDNRYIEQSLRFQWCWQPCKWISAGYEPGGRLLSINGFGQALFYKDNLGILLKIHPSLSLGATLYDGIAHLNRKDFISPRFRWGMGIRPNSYILSVYDLTWSKYKGWRHYAGFGMNLIKSLELNLGFCNNPFSLSIGLSTEIRTFKLSSAAQWNQALGRSHQWGLSWEQ